MLKNICIFSVVFALMANSGFAQQKDKTFQDWTVYHTDVKSKKLCYIVSFPVTKTGNYVKRDAPYFMVTSIANKTDEVSTFAGYSYKLNSKVDVVFDKGGTYYMSLTKDNLAWTKESSLDQQIVADMKTKAFMTLKGVSLRGTYSVDRYSLKGFNAAYSAMKEQCK